MTRISFCFLTASIPFSTALAEKNDDSIYTFSYSDTIGKESIDLTKLAFVNPGCDEKGQIVDFDTHMDLRSPQYKKYIQFATILTDGGQVLHGHLQEKIEKHIIEMDLKKITHFTYSYKITDGQVKGRALLIILKPIDVKDMKILVATPSKVSSIVLLKQIQMAKVSDIDPAKCNVISYGTYQNLVCHHINFLIGDGSLVDLANCGLEEVCLIPIFVATIDGKEHIFHNDNSVYGIKKIAHVKKNGAWIESETFKIRTEGWD